MHGQRAPAVVYRSEVCYHFKYSNYGGWMYLLQVINRLQQSHALVILIADNLTQVLGTLITCWICLLPSSKPHCALEIQIMPKLCALNQPINPQYMDRIRGLGEVLRDADPAEFSPDGRYSHTAQVITSLIPMHSF